MWTDTQQRIITCTQGNIVVVASPGSGKTSVLTEHIVHQLASGTANPSEVMLITYTRQAAKELLTRLSANPAMTFRMVSRLRIGTFHGEAFRMLLQLHVKVPPLLGTHQQYAILRQVLRDEGLNHPFHVTAMTGALTKAKSTWPNTRVEKRYQKAFKRYERLKTRLGRWDYDDILVEFCTRIFAKTPDIPPVLYLLVDEFQDTNGIQWSIIQQFQALWGSRLFVVGDDDQSIYAFRGASPHWLQEAAKIERTQNFVLSTNFRSDERIVEAAKRLILHNRERIQKPFQSHSTNEGSCAWTSSSDEHTEAEAVVALLAQLQTKEPTWSVAVLARTRRQLLMAWNAWQALTSASTVEWHTFHSAKGKEWDAVLLVGVVADNPYLREHAEDREEERRLFYVAMTRARHVLWISYPERTQYGRARQETFIHETGIAHAVQPH